MLSPWTRKLALTIHVVSSVGWTGAVLAYLGVVLAVLLDRAPGDVASTWATFELIGRTVIVPLAVAAFISGLVMGLGTSWGIFRHYWVVFKLILTAVALVILLEHMSIVAAIAAAAARTPDDRSLTEAFNSELVHSVGGLLVLLTTAVLSIFKPRGVTPWGERRLRDPPSARPPTDERA